MKTLYYLTLAILIGLPAAASAHGPTRQKVEETITITAPTERANPDTLRVWVIKRRPKQSEASNDLVSITSKHSPKATA
jgi:hypothetical protein